VQEILHVGLNSATGYCASCVLPLVARGSTGRLAINTMPPFSPSQRDQTLEGGLPEGTGLWSAGMVSFMSFWCRWLPGGAQAGLRSSPCLRSKSISPRSGGGFAGETRPAPGVPGLRGRQGLVLRRLDEDPHGLVVGGERATQPAPVRRCGEQLVGGHAGSIALACCGHRRRGWQGFRAQ
jgi:hypothetical protein